MPTDAPPRLLGYARVSTEGQDTALQRDALRAAGCVEVFEDVASGAHFKREARPRLHALLDALQPGDTLIIWKLDRLGRTTKGLIELVELLSERGVAFRSLTDTIDTTTPQGRFFFHTMAALAEMERDLIRERTHAGLEAARRQGRVGGRPPALKGPTLRLAHQLLDANESQAEVARACCVSLKTIKRLAARRRHASP